MTVFFLFFMAIFLHFLWQYFFTFYDDISLFFTTIFHDFFYETPDCWLFHHRQCQTLRKPPWFKIIRTIHYDYFKTQFMLYRNERRPPLFKTMKIFTYKYFRINIIWLCYEKTFYFKTIMISPKLKSFILVRNIVVKSFLLKQYVSSALSAVLDQ